MQLKFYFGDLILITVFSERPQFVWLAWYYDEQFRGKYLTVSMFSLIAHL